MEVVGILRPQVLDGLDPEPSHDLQGALHAGNLHEHALMLELEKALGRDSSALGEALAVDLQGRFVDKLVRVIDPGRSQSPNVGVGDSSQVLQRSVHALRILTSVPESSSLL